MSSPCLKAALVLVSMALMVPGVAGAQEPLRVCADPNNLPLSDDRHQGFENRIAELAARDFGRPLDYVWWAQRRGFIRNTLKAGVCDVLIGVPARSEQTLNTRPYYQSSYVFVARAERGLRVTSFDDPRLRQLRIGVQMIGNDFANTPPAHALSRRGIIDNVSGYMIYGDYAAPDPAGRIIEAVARGEVDLAVVWGPFAGYFAQHQPVPLSLDPIGASSEPESGLRFAFDIAMGVRRDDKPLHRLLDGFIERRRPDIDAILAEYGVPRVDR
jgi:mxaJ protein